MHIPIKALWLLLIIRLFSNSTKANNVLREETPTLSHLAESTESEPYKNVIFSSRSRQIRPTARAEPATVAAEFVLAKGAGNHSNYNAERNGTDVWNWKSKLSKFSVEIANKIAEKRSDSTNSSINLGLKLIEECCFESVLKQNRSTDNIVNSNLKQEKVLSLKQMESLNAPEQMFTLPKHSVKNYSSEYKHLPLDKSSEQFYRSNKNNTVEKMNNVWPEIRVNNFQRELELNEFSQRSNYMISKMNLENKQFSFQFVSGLFSFIYTSNPTIGLLKELFWDKFSFPSSFIESFQQEWVFIAVAAALACSALILPCYLLVCAVVAACGSRRSEQRSEEDDQTCRRRLRIAELLVGLLMCCVCAIGMCLSNESASEAVRLSARVLQHAQSDLSTWSSAAARDLKRAVVLPAEHMLASYKLDLNNVEQLLGEPIQRAISSESGIELVLDSVNDITAESSELFRKIVLLRELCTKATQLASATADRLTDLGRQLDIVKKECIGKDAPLCDTINTKALEIKIHFDLVLAEKQLLELRPLGTDNLTRAAQAVREHVTRLPAAIAAHTLPSRQQILRVIEARYHSVAQATTILDDMARHLSTALRTTSMRMEALLKMLSEYDWWRWIVMLGCATGSGLVIILTACSLLCGCRNPGRAIQITIPMCVFWTTVVSLALWAAVTLVFVSAGLAEVYICRAFWDSPKFSSLSSVLDRRSNRLSKSVFELIFEDLDNITIYTPISEVIRECEQDRAAYLVFRLDRVLDVDRQTAYFEWAGLQAGLSALSAAVDAGSLRAMSLDLSHTLLAILRVSQVDLAKFRQQYNGPLVGKDLASLADQLENIAGQLSELSVSAKIEALVSRTRRLIATNISPLEQLRSELVYKLTEVELQLVPFHRQVNTSLSHIRTMQYYVDNQGAVIAQKKVSTYTSRLVFHVTDWRTQALRMVSGRAARCKPVFDVFSAVRCLACSHYVASLHGFWSCGLCCALLWCYVVPGSVRLGADVCRRRRDCSYDTTGSQLLVRSDSSQHEIMSVDSQHWNIPAAPPMPRNDGW